MISMPCTIKENDDKRQRLYEKRLLQQQKSQQRQREKQLQRLQDENYQQEQRQKQLASQQRQAEKQQQRQREKQQDPEFQKQQRLKQQQQAVKKQAKSRVTTSPLSYKPIILTPLQIEKRRLQQQAMQQRMQEKQQQKLIHNTKKTPRAIKSKGLKGRNYTAEEKRLANKLAQIGCICCLNQGWTQTQDYQESGQNFISLHHVEGRIKPWAHAKVLPLCHYHHQTPAPCNAPAELFPLHGNAKPVWEKINGTQEHLLKQAYSIIKEPRPWVEQAETELA